MKNLLMILTSIIVLGSCQVQRPTRIYRYNYWQPGSWFYYNQPLLVPSYSFPVYIYPNSPVQQTQPTQRREVRRIPSRTSQPVRRNIIPRSKND